MRTPKRDPTPPEKLGVRDRYENAVSFASCGRGRQNHDFKPACVLIPPPSESDRSDAGILRSEWGEGR